jgi:two-component system response regulator YesN
MGKTDIRPSIDLTALKTLGEDYCSTTGLPLLLVNPEGMSVWNIGHCPLCSKLSASRKREKLCGEYRSKAIEESFRWGEPYISFCPFGLVTFAVSISQEKKIAGGLISGFCIFPQMTGDVRDDVMRSIRRYHLGVRIDTGMRLSFKTVSSSILRKDASLLFDLTFKYGASDPDVIQESQERSHQQFTISNLLEDAREGGQDLAASLVGMQNEIIDKVVLGDISGSREIINRFLGAILLETGMNFNRLKVRLLELIVIISRAAIDKGISADGLLGPRYSYVTEIGMASAFDDLFWKVTKVLVNFNRTVSDEMGRKGWAHMTKMRDYVEKNFNSKVTAAQVADVAGLSVSRALHLFRKESGMSLSTYIAKCRVDYAKQLLANSTQSVADIATDCGFFDQSHFTKTFTALENVSPVKYRARVIADE